MSVDGTFEVIANNHSRVYAFEHSTVQASHECSVIAKDQASISLWDEASAKLRDRSRGFMLSPGCSVECFDESTVVVRNGSRVSAHGESIVKSYLNHPITDVSSIQLNDDAVLIDNFYSPPRVYNRDTIKNAKIGDK